MATTKTTAAKKTAAKKTATKTTAAKTTAAKKTATKKSDRTPLEALHDELFAFALSLPEAWPDSPWGERVAKVGKKVFAFFGVSRDGTAHLSVKLPESAPFALELPFTAPTGYGLGKAGWVSATLTADVDVTPQMLRDWVTESYRAVAPKKLANKLDKTA